jgi:hypothetical protein
LVHGLACLLLSTILTQVATFNEARFLDVRVSQKS